jgi:hypothetical protein
MGSVIIAIMDALQAPEVESILAAGYHGRVGDEIIVRATDDFKVASVIVSIHDLTGVLVEQGNATMKENNADWLYKTVQLNSAFAGSKITAIATDLPGNSASLSISLESTF